MPLYEIGGQRPTIAEDAWVAPSADLILWSRLGWPYLPADLVRLVEEAWRSS